ncbi:MAG TPA: acyltransferase [Verrucomicrobiae bacterium]|nr:acyltransferase [Verrucomicrobiae bacterium]
MNKPSAHIGFLDYFRGVAILSVFLFHSLDASFHHSSLPWHGWLPDFSVSKAFLFLLPVTIGWAGVAIFFVISGFCIHYSFYQQGGNWRAFFIRRFFRIYPPYFFVVLLFALLYLSNGLNFSHQYVDWYQVIMHLLLIHNFDPLSYQAISPSFWSIAIEVQLYLIYPLLLMLVARFGWRRTLILVATCEFLIRGIESLVIMKMGTDDLDKMWQVSRVTYLLDASPFAYWFSWSLGASIADAFLNGRPLPLAKSSLAFWSALVFGSHCIKPLTPFFFTIVAVWTATAISKLLIQNRTIPVPSFCLSHLRLTGIWSYSIYLLHQSLIVMGLGALLVICPAAKNDALLRFGFCLVLWFAIMPIGNLWYRICELPSIACGKRIACPRPPTGKSPN